MEFKTLLTSAAIVALSAGFASAQDDATLSVDGEVIKTRADAPAFAENLDTVYSGWHFRSGETQVLQMDDFENPAFVFVDQGVDLFDKVEGSEGKACASCHEDVADFAGLRPTLPRMENGELVTMEDLVNECRTDRMGAEPWKYSGGQMTSVTALIGLQSRGMSINVAVDGDAAPFFERGKDLYYQRVGQLDMACSNCHEDNYGVMIRADHLSQGQINGFPVYRLKNTKLNGSHSRFKGCIRDTRAETYSAGSPEFVALELYVASRGNGLSVEGPSVRN